MPKYESKYHRYFGTVALLGVGVSLFYSFDMDGEDPARDIINYSNRLIRPSALVSAVVHDSELAPGLEGVSGDVSNRYIVVRGVSVDTASDCEMPYDGSKIFGRPYVDRHGMIETAFHAAYDEGFWQLIQFDTPYSQPDIDGFPWDPGRLHVFVRGDDPKYWDFAFVIQF